MNTACARLRNFVVVNLDGLFRTVTWGTSNTTQLALGLYACNRQLRRYTGDEYV